MNKAVTRGQVLQLFGVAMMNVDLEELDASLGGDCLQTEVINLSPVELGARFTAFIRNGCRLMIGSKTLQLGEVFFNPTSFIGAGWSTWKGPANEGGLTGEEEVDTRSLSLAEIDLGKSIFESGLRQDETSIVGEEKLRRARKSGNIQFAGNVFLALWQDYQKDKENSCLEWLWRNRQVSFIAFLGQVLRSPAGRRYVLCLCRDAGGWNWLCNWLDYKFGGSALSGALASPQSSGAKS